MPIMRRSRYIETSHEGRQLLMNGSMLEAAFQALPTTMAILDKSGTILYVNAAWIAFAHENGAPLLAETSVGRNYLAASSSAEGDGADEGLVASSGIAAVLAGTVPFFTLEYPCHSPDEQRWFLLYAAPLPGESGGAVVEHLDITERKLLEQTVAAANQEMSEFLSLVSHELRAPLTSVKGYVQLARHRLQRLQAELRKETLPPEVLERHLAALERTFEQAEAPMRRLNRMAMDLAEVAHIQSGRLSLQRVPSDLVAIVREVVKQQQLTSPDRSIHLTLPKRPVRVEVDQDRIEQVLTNYLTNALKYAPADRPIEVRLHEEAERVRVEVSDQGPGLRPEERERIWERFYRIHDGQAEKPAEGNLGMGLYICRHFIAQHGGQTGVESTLGAGATFWLTLPRDHTSAVDQTDRSRTSRSP